MSIISDAKARELNLEFHSLGSIGMAGLTMRTADNREAPLTHWVHLTVGIVGIWRDIRCFVAPFYHDNQPSLSWVSLLLGLPWLFSVNAVFTIRGSIIEIGDQRIGEERREIVGPQMVFSKKHNLIMYPKNFLPQDEEGGSDSEDTEDDEEDDESVELSDPSDAEN